MAEADSKQPISRLAAPLTALLRRIAPGLRVLPLALGTLLLLLGGFLAWQGWLVWRTQTGIEEADGARASAIRAIALQIAASEQAAQKALADDSVQQALMQDSAAGREAAAIALKQLLPDATDAAFFSPDLDEVLSGDISLIGYAKAAALMQAKVHPEHPPAEMRVEPQAGQQLMLALPARVQGKVVAFAVVELPFISILQTFRATQISGARLDLRQGDGRGDQQIASIGSRTGNSIGDLGEPIPGSRLRIGKAEPDYFIVTSRSVWLVSLMSLLCLVGGVAALWLRQVGAERALSTLRGRQKPIEKEITLAQAIKQQPVEGPAPTSPKATPNAPSPRRFGNDEVVNVDPSIFRMYDIRGVVGQSLTTGVARMIGRAVGSEARDRGLHEIVIGRDGRLSGPDLVAALTQGLRSTGMDVIDIGAAATPVTYFAAYHLRAGSCISVTGSHNPPDYNGFKIVLGGETLSEDAIQNLYKRIEAERFVDGMGGLQTIDINGDYIRRITDDIQIERKLKVVVDCGNGIPGAIAPAVLEGIGCEVIPLYCDVDGTFPNHHPDPSDLHNLQDLIMSVKQVGADLGLAFDGDGDRLGVVTASGEVIFPDRLLMLFAIDILTRNPGATIIYDVKCTGHLQPLILQHGGSPLMWRTGHSLIKAKMKETDAALAGEMSGHFFFGERWYSFDDAIYAAARLMEILASDIEQRTPQEVFDTLPKGVSTPELKIPMHEGEHYRFMETFSRKATFEGARLTTIDGVRADWPDGWGLVRASNTTPVLVLRFDADNAKALRRIQDVFRSQLLALDSSLPLPF